MREPMHSALDIWHRKLEFFQRELAIAADPSQKFELEQDIADIRVRIAELAAEADRAPASGDRAFDVFLSHNTLDKPTVRRLADSLRQRGLRVWLDEWELVPGRPWQESLEAIIQTTKSAAVLVGKAGLAPWESPEMRDCLAQFVERRLPVIPVLLPGAAEVPELPLFLTGLTWVDLRAGFNDDVLARLEWGITGTKPAISGAVVIPTEGIRRSRITEVFTTVGLPQYTYVEPGIYDDLTISIDTAGKHILLQGPSGSGKTCLIRRVLEDLRLAEDREFCWLSALERDCSQRAIELVTASINGTHHGIVVVDDVHLLDTNTRAIFAAKLKQLSDTTYGKGKPTTFIMIGIPTSAESLLINASDLGPRLEVRRMPLASREQLLRLIHEGEKRLSIRFKDRELLVNESGNSFCLCQNICLNACRMSGVRETQEHTVDIPFEVAAVRKYLVDQLSHRFLPLLITFCKQGRVGTGLRNPFLTILRLLAGKPKQVVRLTKLLAQAGEFADALEQSKAKIKPALDEAQGGAFQQLLHYDEQLEAFSIEDPMMQYYLRHIDMDDLAEPLGCLDEYRELCNGAARTKEDEPVASTSELTSIQSRNDVFFSYSHQDKRWLDALLATLAPLVRGKTISVWWDGAIKPGQKWRDEIRQALKSSKVGVLLVSRNFLASDFINDEELPFLLESANREGVKLIWVLAGNCLFDKTPIHTFQAAHDIGRPLNSLSEAELDNALVEICRNIAAATERAT